MTEDGGVECPGDWIPMATSVGEATRDYGFHVPTTVTILREGGLERDPGADAALCCPSDRNFRTVAVAVAVVTTPHVTSHPPVASRARG